MGDQEQLYLTGEFIPEPEVKAPGSGSKLQNSAAAGLVQEEAVSKDV